VANLVSLQNGQIDNLPFPDQSFEVILCFSAVEYISDDEAVFSELSRVLRPNGLLFLTVPSRRSAVRVAERAIACAARALNPYLRDEHYLTFQAHQYVPSMLDLRLRKYGLAIRTRRFWSIGFGVSRPTWLLRVLERAWWAGMYCGVYVMGPRDAGDS
jgi:ubiquinone/menaquinone biosynthesis C-methylase UbiE